MARGPPGSRAGAPAPLLRQALPGAPSEGWQFPGVNTHLGSGTGSPGLGGVDLASFRGAGPRVSLNASGVQAEKCLGERLPRGGGPQWRDGAPRRPGPSCVCVRARRWSLTLLSVWLKFTGCRKPWCPSPALPRAVHSAEKIHPMQASNKDQLLSRPREAGRAPREAGRASGVQAGGPV